MLVIQDYCQKGKHEYEYHMLKNVVRITVSNKCPRIKAAFLGSQRPREHGYFPRAVSRWDGSCFLDQLPQVFFLQFSAETGRKPALESKCTVIVSGSQSVERRIEVNRHIRPVGYIINVVVTIFKSQILI